FDTTALALSLVFALYFLQFFSRKQDGALAASVSRLVDSELKGRFQSENASGFAANDLDATRRFLQSVAGAFEEATRAQTDLWGETMANAAQKSAELAYGAANRFGEALDKRLADGSAEWTRTLTESQREFVEKTVRPALEETARVTARIDALEARIADQAEALNGVLQASADVVAIEDRLTRTLEKIAEVGEFEKTLNNLSATVCLLNSKLTGAASSAPRPDVVPFSDGLARRASRRSDALAALDSLENSLAELESDPNSEPLTVVDGEERETPPMPALDGSEPPAAPKRPRASGSKKRSA
ncbi:MAG: hypothetical protein IIY32_05420, partial [Thermoguttaceae bacterium]|nr:hypothetical protein [Thermoguttaceae bacterium]